MAYSTAFVQVAQSVHLAIKNRYYDDIPSDDGQNYLAQVADWTNQWLDEIETVTDRVGNVIRWKFCRSNNYLLGNPTTGDQSLVKPTAIDTLVAVPERYALLTVGGNIRSRWRVVNIDQISNFGQYQEDKIALVGDTIYLSRPIRASEDGGDLRADVALSLPRIDEPTNEFSVLTMIKPKQLLILGIAKNSSLPDLVRGGLSPSFLQRYQDLLQNAIQKDAYSSTSDRMSRDNLSYVRGVGF